MEIVRMTLLGICWDHLSLMSVAKLPFHHCQNGVKNSRFYCKLDGTILE